MKEEKPLLVPRGQHKIKAANKIWRASKTLGKQRKLAARNAYREAIGLAPITKV